MIGRIDQPRFAFLPHIVLVCLHLHRKFACSSQVSAEESARLADVVALIRCYRAGRLAGSLSENWSERKSRLFTMPEHAEERSWRSLVTPRKLSFYLIFHGFHIALFIIGWYVTIFGAGMQADNHQVETADPQGTGASQPTNVLGVDIKRRWTGSQRRCHSDHATHV